MNGGASLELDRAAVSILNPLIFPLVPPEARDPIMILWKLNSHLSAMARGGREAMLRLIKLRWWADQLDALDDAVIVSDPLLTSVQHGLLPHVDSGELSALAQAWMAAVDDGSTSESWEHGALLFTMTGQLLGESRAELADFGRLWAMLDHAMANDQQAAEWSEIRHFKQDLRSVTRPRSIAALSGLVGHVIGQYGARQPIREQLCIFRIGLFGR